MYGTESCTHPECEFSSGNCQDLLERTAICLKKKVLTLNIEKSKYRIFYTEEMEILFQGDKASLEPIINWLKERI